MCFFVVKLVNVSVTFMLSQNWHQKPPHPCQPTLLSTGYNLDLTMQSFIFQALLHNAIGGGEKTL